MKNKYNGFIDFMMRRGLMILLGMVILGLLLVFAITGAFSPTQQQSNPEPEKPQVVVKEVEKEVEKIVEVKREITADIIKDGLRNMGFLITGEYYFTEVISDEKSQNVANLFSIPLASYVISYDGVVTAGVDFNKIKVEKDEESHTITITMPKAEIKNVDVDPKSFQVYEEKSSVFQSYSVSEYNDALIELEEKASSKAIERGLLKTAQSNAETVISGFVSGLLEDSFYTIEFVKQ